MKTAFAYWDERIAPVFDTARHVHIIETKSGKFIGEKREIMPEGPMIQKASRLAHLGIGSLVCGAISRQLHDLLSLYGIRVIPFVAGNLREVIQAWLLGNPMLEAFVMPGCRGRGRRRIRGMPGTYQEANNMKGRGRGNGGGRRGRGQGGQGGQISGRRGRSPTSGVLGYCVCPQCGRTEPHKPGMPCVERQCPKCGTAMMRQ